MKKYLYWFSMFVIFATGRIFADDLTDDWGQVTNNIQMSICLESNKNEIKANEFVRLIIRLRNLSTNMSFYARYELAAETDPRVGVSCTVISPSEKDISPKPEKAGGGSGGGGVVGPNKTMEFAFRLSDVCKFNEHGTSQVSG